MEPKKKHWMLARKIFLILFFAYLVFAMSHCITFCRSTNKHYSADRSVNYHNTALIQKPCSEKSTNDNWTNKREWVTRSYHICQIKSNYFELSFSTSRDGFSIDPASVQLAFRGFTHALLYSQGKTIFYSPESFRVKGEIDLIFKKWNVWALFGYSQTYDVVFKIDWNNMVVSWY